MAFNRYAEYPPNSESFVTLTTTPIDVGPAVAPLVFDWAVLVGGAADEIVIFRTQDGLTEHFRVSVPAGAVVPLGGLELDDDLEILTASAAGDVGFMVAYW